MKQLIMILSLLFTNSIFSQIAPTELKNILGEYLEKRNKIIPINGTVLVMKGKEIIVNNYYGYQDKKLGKHIDSNTLFPIASSTKPFTATAIMLLADKKLISIEDPVSKWLKTAPAKWADIKIRHLLTHTSGIQEVKVSSLENNEIQNLLKQFQTKNLEFRPGEKFSYRNINFILLSDIIEVITSISFENFIESEILLPLNMRNTGFVYLYKGKDMAVPYFDANKLNQVPKDQLMDMRMLKGAGGMYSTALDLVKFLNGLSSLLSKTALSQMWQVNKEDYGYGWHIQEQFGKMAIKHSGGFNGYSSEMRYVPVDSLSIIILSNASFNDLFSRYTAFDMMKLFNHVELGYDLEVNAAVLGKYLLPDDFAAKAKSKFIEVKLIDNRLVLTGPGPSIKYLVPISKNRYFFYGEAVDVEFDGNGLMIINSPSFGKIMSRKE